VARTQPTACLSSGKLGCAALVVVSYLRNLHFALFKSPLFGQRNDIVWCTQIGLFQFCFRSRDLFTGAGFPQLISMPSPVSVVSQQSVERSSCVFIRSQGPPSSNPAPVFLPPTPYTTCTEECCPCCGEGPTCPCQGVIQMCNQHFSLVNAARVTGQVMM
jgi:hypothetical protein